MVRPAGLPASSTRETVQNPSFFRMGFALPEYGAPRPIQIAAHSTDVCRRFAAERAQNRASVVCRALRPPALRCPPLRLYRGLLGGNMPYLQYSKRAEKTQCTQESAHFCSAEYFLRVKSDTIILYMVRRRCGLPEAAEASAPRRKKMKKIAVVVRLVQRLDYLERNLRHRDRGGGRFFRPAKSSACRLRTAGKARWTAFWSVWTAKRCSRGGGGRCLSGSLRFNGRFGERPSSRWPRGGAAAGRGRERPARTTTYGVGELIRHALEQARRRLF